MKIQNIKEWVKYKGKQFKIHSNSPVDFHINSVIRIKDEIKLKRSIKYRHVYNPELSIIITKFDDDLIHVQYRNIINATNEFLPDLNRFQINSLKFTGAGLFMGIFEGS